MTLHGVVIDAGKESRGDIDETMALVVQHNMTLARRKSSRGVIEAMALTRRRCMASRIGGAGIAGAVIVDEAASMTLAAPRR